MTNQEIMVKALLLDMVGTYNGITSYELTQFAKRLRDEDIHAMTYSLKSSCSPKELFVVDMFASALVRNYSNGGGTAVKMLTNMHRARQVDATAYKF